MVMRCYRDLRLNDGRELEAQLISAGRNHHITIAFINGWTGLMNFWEAQLPLTDKGYTLLGFNAAGLGKSDKPLAGELYINQIARDTLCLFGKLNIKRPVIIAHGLGALYALEYLKLVSDEQYLEYRPDSIVLVTPVLANFVESLPERDLLLASASKLTRTSADRIEKAFNIAGDGLNAEIDKKVVQMIKIFKTVGSLIYFLKRALPEVRANFSAFLNNALKTDPGVRDDTLHEAINAGPALYQSLCSGEICLPAKILFIAGRYDLFVGPDELIKLIKKIRGSNAGRTEIQINVLEQGHFPYQENPQAFNDLVAAFLKSP